jgi:hypothetical protein
MSEDRPESLVSQLDSSDWIARSIAVIRLRGFPDALTSRIPRVFELTFDDHAPLASDAEGAIKFTKSAAIPFLLSETKSPIAGRRQRAIELLAHAGFWCGGTTRLAIQELEPRKGTNPEWGDRSDDVLAAATHLISDPDLSVRFAAASLLEDVGLNHDQTIPVFIDVLANGTTFQQNWSALRLGRIAPAALIARPPMTKLIELPPADGLEPREAHAEQRARLAIQVGLRRIGCT